MDDSTDSNSKSKTLRSTSIWTNDIDNEVNYPSVTIFKKNNQY